MHNVNTHNYATVSEAAQAQAEAGKHEVVEAPEPRRIRNSPVTSTTNVHLSCVTEDVTFKPLGGSLDSDTWCLSIGVYPEPQFTVFFDRQALVELAVITADAAIAAGLTLPT